MTQTSNRFYDQFARLMNDAAGVAQGVRREAQNLFRSQAERMASDLDLVRREDFDAVREMASRAREENERLQRRIDELDAKLSQLDAKAPGLTRTSAGGPVDLAEGQAAAAKSRGARRSSSPGGKETKTP